ncbi:hypothetical protein IAR55_001947 [Kwoniella newhampshirensis]|uniref:Uncharacterized protein n=1 Tax=Kwoniella newhampshirensis TaxID=1651941 RepID=A0AAW0Z3K1_9TREE
MLAPQPRIHSSTTSSSLRTSSSPPSSFTWSEESGRRTDMPGGRASTRTSIWSDDATEVAHTQVQGGVKEGRLIDIDDDDDDEGQQRQEEENVMAPSDKLRDLLRQMDEEARRAKPLDVVPSRRNSDSRLRSSRGSLPAASPRQAIHSHSEEEAGQEDQQEESPPTPPPRIGNPYASRRVSGDRRGSPNLLQSGRLPSRAAVLLRSTSRSSPEEPPAPLRSPPSQLRTYIASQRDLPSHPSSSRSARPVPHSYASPSLTSSRKGKEREQSPPPGSSAQVDGSPGSSTSRRNRFQSQQRQIFQHVPQHPDSSPERDRPRRRLPPTTPRRLSVDMAPDDLASFARNMPSGGLELRGEVELDLDEGLSSVVGWENASESVAEESLSRRQDEIAEMERSEQLEASRRSSPPYRSTRERSFTPRPSASSPPNRPTARETSLRHLTSSSRLSPQLHHSASATPTGRPLHSPSPPLPALPEPDISQASDSSEIDTYSSRRAALFRSTSKSTSGASASTLDLGRSGTSNTPSFRTDKGSQSRISLSERRETRSPISRPREDSPVSKDSPSSAKNASKAHSKMSSASQQYSSTSPFLPRQAADISIPPQEPVTVGMSTLSTSSPVQRRALSSVNPEQIREGRSEPADLVHNMPTPKPPGAWQSTPRGKVRFSPLRKEARYEDSFQDEGGEGVSILRMRVSPKKVGLPMTQDKGEGRNEPKPQSHEADTSWTGKLSRSFTKLPSPVPIPRPSATYNQASSSLSEASSNTLLAQRRLESTQKQWLEALSAISAHDLSPISDPILRESISKAVRKSWGWGSWAWWVVLEMLVLWGVFRVTLDYANSVGYMTGMDPFHPLARPLGLGTGTESQFSSGRAGVAGGQKWSTWSSETRGTPIDLSLPIPGALQTLVGGGSANFFDLIEGWQLWRRLSGTEPVSGPGIKMLSGVPT